MHIPPVDIVEAFNDCITRKDIGELSKLMTDDHLFIDSANTSISGKARSVEAWKRFFSAFPDYQNHFERVIVLDGRAVMIGHSTCSDARLAGPALWTATIVGDRVAEWRVYEDTSANRMQLGIKD
jgi:ketosteroid isomerase-like protein